MKKILLVEDDEALVGALTSELNQNNEFTILAAKDGNEGLKVALKEHPHIILLDLLMPKMDGITMLKKLRQDEWGKNVKVLILTNLDDKDKIAEAIDSRVFDYMIKSNWNIGDVYRKVSTELKYID